MTKWQTKQIRNLGRVVTGKTPPKNEPHYFDGDELFVSPKDLDWDQLYVAQTETRVSSKALEKFRNQVIPKNTVMFTSLSFGFGKMGITSRASLTNQQINSIVVNNENYFRFVYYLLRACTPFIFAYNSGIDTPIVPKSVFERIGVKCSDLPLQRKIAAILWAHDELIDNNKRRIALLEKMAEEIYREWFVRLRFPSHEKVKIVKGVPEGWEVRKLGELARTQYGYTASADMEEQGPKFLRITDIVPAAIDWELVPRCKIEEKDEEKYLLHEGDIVVARTGATVGYAKRINKRHPKVVFASYLVRLIPNRKNTAIFLGLSVERSAFKDFIWMFVTGAAQPQANATTMALFPVLYPPEPLLNEFNRIAEPILDEKELLLNQMTALSRTRDLFLPRLISGKLSVENLDIQFPPGMAEEAEAVT